MNQLFVPTHVIKNCRKLDQLPQCSDFARRADVLMADNGFTDRFCLSEWRMEGFWEEVKGEDATIEFEWEEGAMEVLFCSADVVEEAGKEVRFVAKVPIWKLLSTYSLSCMQLQN